MPPHVTVATCGNDTGDASIRVASVPGSHLYVRHLSNPDGADRVVRLDDPVPSDGAKVPGGWWPPLMLDPGWIRENHSRFDVFHIHFGFDAIGTDDLGEVIDELMHHGKPLVYTVHDLRNPHQRDSGAHEKQQDVLVPAADELVTLTPGAADVIRARWGRSAVVQPHPHVLDPAQIRRPRNSSADFVVGVHVKSLRANMDPFPVLDALVDTIGDLGGATLQIDVHDEIFDPDNHFYAPRAGADLLTYARHRHVDVRVHRYFTDDELWQYLSSLSASVLPYRFGTHSGWLEACFDLGTAVVAPSCGFYGQQRPCEVFGYTETRFDADSLDRAVRVIHDRSTAGTASPRATWDERCAERTEVSRAHAALYDRVLS
jgi:hypothetical protein